MIILSSNNITNGDVPLGFGMVLAQNLEAMRHFSSLPRERQNEIISRAKSVNSKQEMRDFVSSLLNY